MVFVLPTALGWDLSAQYQVSPAEQRTQIQQLADAILSDQSVGELAQLVEQENNASHTAYGNLTGATVDGYNKNTEAYPMSRYFNTSEPIFEAAKRVTAIEGYEDIFIHGNTTGFSINDANGNMIGEYTPREFAEVLQNDPNYHGGDIRLCSCCTGAKDSIAAKALARQLKINVLAPSDTLWIHTDGSMTIGCDATDNSGTWILFEGREER